MVKGRLKPTPVNAPAEVVFDPSASGARKPRRLGAPSASNEWRSFMVCLSCLLSEISLFYWFWFCNSSTFSILIFTSLQGSSLSDMYRKPVSEKSADTSDDEPDIDIGKLLKDVELFGNYSITVYTTYTDVVMFLTHILFIPSCHLMFGQQQRAFPTMLDYGGKNL